MDPKDQEAKNKQPGAPHGQPQKHEKKQKKSRLHEAGQALNQDAEMVPEEFAEKPMYGDPHHQEESQGESTRQESKPARKIATGAELLATMASRLVLGLLLFAGFGIGFWVAGVALHDPDTCWLLALGRYIVENHQIPQTDPFSWTFAAEQAAGQHFVLYQWLTEVVFYCSTLPAGLVTLLLLCAVTISTAFLSLPMSFVVRREAPFVQSALAIVLGLLAASFHTLARPEIFSYLWMAIFLQLLHHARTSSLNGEKKIFPLVFVMAPVMVIWANMHTGFVAGFAVTLAVALGSGLSILFFKAPVKALFVSALTALGGCLIAALLNPYGVELYEYIPKLFNASINKYIIELQPVIGPYGEIGWEFWPFIALCILFLFLIAREGMAYVSPKARNASAASQAFGQTRAEATASEPAGVDGSGTVTEATSGNASGFVSGNASGNVSGNVSGNASGFAPAPRHFDRKLLACELLICFIMGQVAIFNGLVHRRVASFVTLALVGEIIALLGLNRHRRAKVEDAKKFWPLLDHHSLDLWKAGGTFEMAIVALCAVAGVTLVSFRICKPELPAGSTVFKPPFQAITFIEKNHPQGKLFNDQQFGDMLIYYLKGNPKVFIDTRFDMYGSRLVEEYISIHECQPGWREKLNKTGADWVFLLPSALLAIELKKDPGWHTIYADDSAVILQRSK